MKLAACCVLYNPESIGIPQIVNNIKSYSLFCEKIYIVDNSPVENENYKKTFLSSIEKSNYIYNGNKGGIAGAHNRSCQKALKEDCDYILLMDQDSFFDKGQFSLFLTLIEEYASIDKNLVSFSPSIKNLNKTVTLFDLLRKKILSPLKRKILGKNWKPRIIPDVVYPTEVIASGNVFKLSAWSKVNGFDEKLFIDEVDFDFCHKLIRYKYKIITFNKVQISHFFGTKIFSLIKRNYQGYKENRIYYIFRNQYIEKNRFPEYKKKYDKLIKKAFFDFCINTAHIPSRIKLFLKARKDAFIFISQDTF